jgi:hypothetical protein
MEQNCNPVFSEIYKSAEEFLESTLGNNNGFSHPGYVAEAPVVSVDYSLLYK